MDTSLAQANKRRKTWGILLLVGPIGLIVVALLAYAGINFALGATGGESSSAVKTVLNVALYLIGALGVIAIVPAAIGGIVLLATQKHTPATASAPGQPVAAPAVPGQTVSIVGLVFAFVGLALPGLILSIIGLVKAKKAGRSNTIAVLGIVFNALFVVLTVAYIGVAIALAINHEPTTQPLDSNSGSSIQEGTPTDTDTPNLFN